LFGLLGLSYGGMQTQCGAADHGAPRALVVALVDRLATTDIGSLVRTQYREGRRDDFSSKLRRGIHHDDERPTNVHDIAGPQDDIKYFENKRDLLLALLRRGLAAGGDVRFY